MLESPEYLNVESNAEGVIPDRPLTRVGASVYRRGESDSRKTLSDIPVERVCASDLALLMAEVVAYFPSPLRAPTGAAVAVSDDAAGIDMPDLDAVVGADRSTVGDKGQVQPRHRFELLGFSRERDLFLASFAQTAQLARVIRLRFWVKTLPSRGSAVRLD